MTIVTIIGARPQFIKAAMLSRAIRERQAAGEAIEEMILHTGQHYDKEMSDVFFQQMHIPTPNWNLGCTLPSKQMAEQIVPILESVRPDIVIVYGDTNSTLAGALAAHQCHIPIAHIEAGLRSFNSKMVEEHNRIETDRLSTWLFCPTHTAIDNLHQEGITKQVVYVGDIMFDAALWAQQHPTDILKRLNLPSSYLLATIHRAENTDHVEQMINILTAFSRITTPIVWPIHPRTRKVISGHLLLQRLLEEAHHVMVVDSLSYLDMATLEQHAQGILTDSGGVQKEAYFHHIPCITLREETEWVETVHTGWNRLVGTDTNCIMNAVRYLAKPTQEIAEYGDGHTANKILDILCASY